MSLQLLDLLARDKIITQQQYNETKSMLREGQNPLRLMIERKTISETKLLYFLSQKFGLSTINLEKFEIQQDVLMLVPAELVKKHHAIPIQASKGVLAVAVCDPTVIPGLEMLKFATKMNIEAVLTTYSAFDAAVAKYYAGANLVGQMLENISQQKKGGTSTDLEASSAALEVIQVHDIDEGGIGSDEAPVITLVNGILAEAVRRRASDIHVEPYERRCRVRMRMDGVMAEVLNVPPEMKRATIARLKIMAKMDIAESRIPQDGRIKLRTGNTEIDLRVSSMPNVFGEKIVMRLLNKSNLSLDLTKLGMEPRQLEVFKRGMYAANGMVLVTGPTGSGKTTTLYSALQELNKTSDNIATVEDPVEYNFEGINQTQVHSEIGLTFASALRTMLRQDPDIILVGEIRDFETAEVSIQAALTGHLVLSTIHTNDAPSTVVRLNNMGVEPFLITAAVNTVIAQRLLRTICNKCKMQETVPIERLIKAGIPAEEAGSMKLFKGKGCASCANTGYKGRVAIYEVMDFTPDLKELVLRGETAIELKREAIRQGMKTLRHSAFSKVATGVTTIEEALSNTSDH